MNSLKTEFDRMTERANVMGVDVQLTSMAQKGQDSFILGFWRGEYVTWMYCEGAFHWGHYYKSYNDASNDFYKRANVVNH